ncbi:MAG TPA: hypothetical protein VKB34_18425 [Povalibacter sp.]|nr:hypothetical protein [Povalibacter sp.]
MHYQSAATLGRSLITFIARSRQAQRASRLQNKGFLSFRLAAMHKRYDYGSVMAIKNDASREKSL